MRRIDADKLRKDVLDLPDCYNGFSDTYDKARILDLVDEQPTVDPIKHGHWVVDEDGNIKCSECGHCGVGDNYCERCGADMRGEQDE